jgi:hypothetical protein
MSNRTALPKVSGLVLALALACAARPQERVEPQTKSSDLAAPNKIEFTQNSIGDVCVLVDEPGKPIRVKDAHNRYHDLVGGCPSFTSTDGQVVYTRLLDLISPVYVPKYIERELQNAQILKREPRLDSDGNVIGERIVAIRREPTEPHKRGPNDPYKNVAVILWTDGTFSAEMWCASLDDVLAFEQAYRRVLLHHK